MMGKTHTLLDLFSGIGGFHKGLSDAGLNFDKVYFSEIDKQAISVYKHNFPKAKYVGPVQDVIKNIEKISMESNMEINMITFGFPCQDLSIAGKRSGIGEGTRSGLVFDALKVVNHLQPKVFIAENVKGLLSINNGDDFEVILEEMTKCGYAVDFEVLNTKDWLPQNRERIYIVGIRCDLLTKLESGLYVGTNDYKRAVFKKMCDESKYQIDVFGNPQSNRWRHYTSIIGSIRNQGRQKVLSIRQGDKNNPGSRGKREAGLRDVVGIDANYYKGADGKRTMIQTLYNKDYIPTIRSGGRGSMSEKHSWDIIRIGTLRTHNDGKGFRAVKEEICPTIPARAREDGSSQPVILIHPTIRAEHHNTANVHVINQNTGIRRLLPTETEILQGFEYNWTKHGIFINKNGDDDVRTIADSGRYKMCGNAVSVPVVHAVGKAIINNITGE